jgi:hypothetical protein
MPIELPRFVRRIIFSILFSTLFLSFVGTIVAQSPLLDGRLGWYANQAKAQGKASVVIPVGDVLESNPESLDEALNRTSVVVAKLVSSATTHDKDSIFTWKKYRLTESFTTQPNVPGGELPIAKIPSSLLPLGPGEFLLLDDGGTVVVDGVKTTEQDPDRVVLTEARRHLMFVMFRCSGMMARLNYGAEGLFAVDDSDFVSDSAVEINNPIRKELLARTGGRLSQLRMISPKTPSFSLQKTK